MLIKFLSPKNVLKLMNWWPPYLASGVRVKEVNEDFTSITVELKQYFFNTNYVGTHFGGTLYSMCDPFYMFILLHHLRSDHVVWDQAASIKFIRPGKNTLRATFTISMSEIEKIRSQAADAEKVKPVFSTYIYDDNGQEVAQVSKTLYVRRKLIKQIK